MARRNTRSTATAEHPHRPLDSLRDAVRALFGDHELEPSTDPDESAARARLSAAGDLSSDAAEVHHWGWGVGSSQSDSDVGHHAAVIRAIARAGNTRREPMPHVEPDAEPDDTIWRDAYGRRFDDPDWLAGRPPRR